MAGCLLGGILSRCGGDDQIFEIYFFINILKWINKIYLMAYSWQQVSLKNSLKRHLLLIKKYISFKYERLNKLNKVLKTIGHTTVLWILPRMCKLSKSTRCIYCIYVPLPLTIILEILLFIQTRGRGIGNYDVLYRCIAI